MANRYWVGGTGTWDGSSTANWSASSGGASGASVPVAADAVFFDASSGGGTCTLGATVPCLLINLTGYTGTLNFSTNKIQIFAQNGTIYTQTTSCSVAGTPLVEFATNVANTASFRSFSCVALEANAVSISVTAGVDNFSMATGSIAKNVNFTGFSGTFARGASSHVIYGDLTLSSTMTVQSNVGTINVAKSGSPSVITCNGVTINTPFAVYGAGATFADKFLMGAGRTLILGPSTLDANNKDVDVPAFRLDPGTKTLTLGSGTWTITGSGTAWDAQTNVTGLTVSASTGTISLTSASAKTFAGGAKTWPTLNQGGAGALTIQQSNTFANITNTVQPATITFTSGTTQTVSNFSVSGTSGSVITLNSSSAGSRATISRSSGLTNVSYTDIKDISATGSAFYSYLFNGNVNSGNNIGIRFNLPDTSFIPSVFI